jgi:uncharacterized protein (TIGR00661 family)
MSRILYGVQGEGRGHATRSLRVLQALLGEGHEVLVLTGGDALPVLAPVLGNRIVEIPLLRYRYNARGTLCPWRTVVQNFRPLLRVIFRNIALESAVRRFKPALALSDFEPVTCRLARIFRIPLVAVDHQHFLTETVLPRVHGLGNKLMLPVYRLGTRLLSGWPRRVIVSSFHHFPRKRGSRAVFVGPFLAEEVRSLERRNDGHVAVYLKRPQYLKPLLGLVTAFPDRIFEIFSSWDTEWSDPLPRNAQLRSVSRAGFLESLASAHALITTAGNQVLGEAIWLGKPVLALPEAGVLEQALNARALEVSGCGMMCHPRALSAATWERFEELREGYLAKLKVFRNLYPDYDGLSATLRVIRRSLGTFESPGAGRMKPRGSFSVVPTA